MGKRYSRKKNKEEQRIVRHPLMERLFAHYLKHPKDRGAGDIVDKHHAEQFRRYCMTVEQKKVVFVDKDGNRTIV